MALAGTETAGTIPEHCKSVSFAPAHVSTLFHIHPDDDPLLHGSTGLGICLPQGTYAAVEREPAKRTSISFFEDGRKVKDPVTRRAVELALDGGIGRGGEIHHCLPEKGETVRPPSSARDSRAPSPACPSARCDGPPCRPCRACGDIRRAGIRQAVARGSCPESRAGPQTR